MKRFVLVALGVLLFVNQQANACHTQQNFICPGDKVVDENGYIGRVSGVNPFQKTVSINYGGSSDNIKSISSTALGMGCLEGYCVGDFAVDENGYRGRIDAVNPYNRTVAINYGGSNDNIKNIESVALGIGCMFGYCVGDGVTDDNGYKGKIDSINRYRGTAGVNYGGSNDNIKRIQVLSSSHICEDYGSRARSVQVFPILIEARYPSAKFKYTAARPVK